MSRGKASEAPQETFGVAKQIKGAYGMMYHVTDLGRAVSFYNQLLGQEPSCHRPGWVEYDRDSFKLCLQEHSEANIKNRFNPRLILEVDDLRASTKMLQEQNVRVNEVEHPTVDGGAFTNIEDPDGNIIGLYQVPVENSLTPPEKGAREKLSKSEQELRQSQNELDGFPNAAAEEAD